MVIYYMGKTVYRFLAKIISKGRVTIPEELRIAEDLQVGDIVELKFLRVVKRGSEQVFPRRGDDSQPSDLNPPKQEVRI